MKLAIKLEPNLENIIGKTVTTTTKIGTVMSYNKKTGKAVIKLFTYIESVIKDLIPIRLTTKQTKKGNKNGQNKRAGSNPNS